MQKDFAALLGDMNMTKEDPTPKLIGRDKAVTSAMPDSLEVALMAAHLAEEKKASDTVILDVREKCSYADFFVVTGAPSERQAQAVARNIDDGLRRGGVKPMSTEGVRDGAWVLLDFGDVVVHCFYESARGYYDLEGFWSDAPRLDLDEAKAIASLRKIGLDAHGAPLPQ